jgi:hypothetical protein
MVGQLRRYKRYVEEPQGALHVHCLIFFIRDHSVSTALGDTHSLQFKIIFSVGQLFIYSLIYLFIYLCFIDMVCLWP